LKKDEMDVVENRPPPPSRHEIRRARPIFALGRRGLSTGREVVVLNGILWDQ
jgi:hypothetical protein